VTDVARPGWADVVADDPDLATRAQALLERSGTGEGLLATVRDPLPPRIHPVNVAVVEGRLLTVVLADSAKAADLLADGRYALHGHVDPAVPDEVLVRGTAAVVTDPDRRARAVAGWAFTVPDDALLLELAVDHVLLGERATADEWPPVYRAWRARRA
jgi:hypothetical protein